MNLKEQLDKAREENKRKKSDALGDESESPTAMRMFGTVHKARSMFLDLKYKEIDPRKCRQWAYHNRSEQWLTSQAQQSLAASIERDGQLELGLVREVENDPDVSFEVIYGFRRSEACKSKGIPFKARVLPADTPDVTCLQYMHVENKESQDVSEMEDAITYRRLLADGIVASQSELGAALNLTQGRISQLVGAAEVFEVDYLAPLLRPVIVDLSARACERLAAAIKDPKRVRNVRNAAKRLSEGGSPPLDARKLVATLLEGLRPARPKNDETVLLKVGRRKIVSVQKRPNGTFSVEGVGGVLGDEEKKSVMERLLKEIESLL